MTNCSELQVLLDDLLDGLLADDERRRVEEHLAACATCRATERALRDVLGRAAALPREIEPQRDLWPGIARQLDTRERRARTRWRVLLAAAAVLVVGAFAAGYALRFGIEPPTARNAGVARSAQPAAMPARAVLPPGAAELALIEAKRELRAALEQSRSTLSPRTAALVDDNLVLIEQAIDEIRVALAEDPGNRALQRMLLATHVRELELLERVTGRTTQL